FVLCPECENPETDMRVNPKKETMGNSCKACSYPGMLDTHHQLCTFILKTPPENSDSRAGKKEKEKKNSKGKDKENGSISSKETPQPPPPPNGISPLPHTVEAEEDDAQGEDTTEKAQRHPMDEISDHAEALTLSDALARTAEKKKEEGIIDSSDKEIVAEAERLDVKATGPLVLTEVLFNEKIREQIKKYRRHFLRFCHNKKKYVSKETHVKAEPFMKWLKEAEEESSGGGEDEDENMEVVYSKTASVPKVETVTSDSKDDNTHIDAI
uniref:Uncharacterized protein n=1 Tax=Aotus nancymaae TaxID=37293 RepID=A0A2K5D686_AOTNA